MHRSSTFDRLLYNDMLLKMEGLVHRSSTFHRLQCRNIPLINLANFVLLLPLEC